MKLYTLLMASMLAFVPLAAHAHDDKMPMSHEGGSASDKAFNEANDKMMKDMMVKPSGDADKDFVTMMIPHHQGAIDMAKAELEYGKDPELRKMAEGIIKAQESEIKTMKAWQEKLSK